jgi:hypothetical protein
MNSKKDRGRKPNRPPPMPQLSQFGRQKPPGGVAAMPHHAIKGKKLPPSRPRKSMLRRRPPASAY